MKNIFLMVVLLSTTMIKTVSAQQTTCQPIQSVITSYLQVKNALVKDNGDSVRVAAQTLFESIQHMPMDKLSLDDHKAWISYQLGLSKDAEFLKGTSEIQHQREHFMKLSDNIYKMLKTINSNTTDLYYQYCPMANDGKGAYWISEQEGILNPYYGKRMLKCGSTKETIKAKE